MFKPLPTQAKIQRVLNKKPLWLVRQFSCVKKYLHVHAPYELSYAFIKLGVVGFFTTLCVRYLVLCLQAWDVAGRTPPMVQDISHSIRLRPLSELSPVSVCLVAWARKWVDSEEKPGEISFFVASNQRIFLINYIAIVCSTRALILFYRTPKPKAYWSNGSQDICEDLILTMGARCDQHSNRGSHDFKPSTLPLSYLTFICLQRVTQARNQECFEKARNVCDDNIFFAFQLLWKPLQKENKILLFIHLASSIYFPDINNTAHGYPM